MSSELFSQKILPLKKRDFTKVQGIEIKNFYTGEEDTYTIERYVNASEFYLACDALNEAEKEIIRLQELIANYLGAVK